MHTYALHVKLFLLTGRVVKLMLRSRPLRHLLWQWQQRLLKIHHQPALLRPIVANVVNYNHNEMRGHNTRKHLKDNSLIFTCLNIALRVGTTLRQEQ